MIHILNDATRRRILAECGRPFRRHLVHIMMHRNTTSRAPYLETISDEALTRLMFRLWRIPAAGSWDWPTLVAVHPGMVHALRLAKAEARRRRTLTLRRHEWPTSPYPRFVQYRYDPITEEWTTAECTSRPRKDIDLQT